MGQTAVCADVQGAPPPGAHHRWQHVLGSVRCSFVESNWQQISRVRAPLDGSNRHDFVLYQTRTGTARFRLPQGVVTVCPGECILINTGEPYELESPRPITAVIRAFPQPWLARWIPSPERCNSLFTNADVGARLYALPSVPCIPIPSSHLPCPARRLRKTSPGSWPLRRGPLHSAGLRSSSCSTH